MPLNTALGGNGRSTRYHLWLAALTNAQEDSNKENGDGQSRLKKHIQQLLRLLAILFVVAGIYLAWTEKFEQRAGEALHQAAPAARQIVPVPAKRIFREILAHLPVYGATSSWLARKSGSVVYFGMVGVFVLALRKRKPTSLGRTLLVTVVAAVAMSANVEILEFPEEISDEIFDLGCGACGGVIAGLVAWPFVKRQT